MPTIRVVIETPRGSRNKYAWDPGEKAFVLKKVLPAGMAFPYDFGFIPGTEGEDGDPMDVLVLMDEAAFAGCQVHCRLIGIIEGEQTEDGETVRNDRLIVVEENDHAYATVKHVNDLGKAFIHELEQFFVNYNELGGKKFRVLKVGGPKAAAKAIKLGLKAKG